MLQEQMEKVQPVLIQKIFLDIMVTKQDSSLHHICLMFVKGLESMANLYLNKNFQSIFGKYMTYLIHKKWVFLTEIYVKWLFFIQQESHDDMPLYFRYMTLMAIHVFLEKKVDVAIFEVGIGGEHDCTNVVRLVILFSLKYV